MLQLLADGSSLVLCPGGVQECLHMQHDGSETAYLKRRHGFVKLAMAAGVPLVGV
jgi:2-acylglycerol O-acyltransferase 2